jgi:L-ascorbate metabolism protein UlaG (beta-lactamase superfamily)
VAPDVEFVHGEDHRPWLVWIGHASFLACLGGRRVLVDPVFAPRAGPFHRRHGRPGLEPRQLPPLTAALVTHNHYDHLDAAAIRALPSRVPVVAPAGMAPWLARRGRARIVELEWWQQVEVDGLEITLVPARHWSRRGLLDTNRSLWGGFVVARDGVSIYHAGDTAWFDGFVEIGRRFPGLRAALLPIGGYDPPWFMEHHHLNPEQAGRAFTALGARVFVPMHWGTFQLTDEPLSEPLHRVVAWWREDGPTDGRELRPMAVGEGMVLE